MSASQVFSKQGGVSSLPPEIQEFFATPGRALLVKGLPGVGKTLFSLNLLFEHSGFYVTTRVDPAKLRSEVPWLGDEFFEKCVIDATQSKYSPAENTSMEKVLRTIRYASLPEFIRHIYDVTEEEDVENPYLVIDSWDSVLSSIKTSEKEMERGLIELARTRGVNLVLITEYYGIRALDFIVDGVIELKRKTEDGNLIRMLYIEKLRSTPIRRASHLFTLHGGKFRYIEPFQGELKGAHLEETEEKKGYYSTGIEEMDFILDGGYRKGSFVLFEMNETVPQSMVLLLVSSTVRNFFRHKRAIAATPSTGRSVENLVKAYNLKKGDETLFKMIVPPEIVVAKGCERFIIRSGYHPESWIGSKTLIEDHNISLEYIDLNVLAGETDIIDAVKVITGDMQQMRESNGLFITVSVEKMMEQTRNLAGVADYYFKLSRIGDSMVFRGLKPHTLNYGLEYNDGRLTFVPIV